jgi:hypothetical protein
LDSPPEFFYAGFIIDESDEHIAFVRNTLPTVLTPNLRLHRVSEAGKWTNRLHPPDIFELSF